MQDTIKILEQLLVNKCVADMRALGRVGLSDDGDLTRSLAVWPTQ